MEAPGDRGLGRSVLEGRGAPDPLEEALTCCGAPAIINTDQGSQFTSLVFTGCLQAAGIRISVDGRGRCMDNIFIERLWRSLKYEAVYLHEIADGFTARRVIGAEGCRLIRIARSIDYHQPKGSAGDTVLVEAMHAIKDGRLASVYS